MQLSEYQLSCGYIQQKTLKTSYLFETKIELYKEHNCYHVRAFNYVKGSSSCDKIAWTTFDELKNARKYFKSLSKTIEG